MLRVALIGAAGLAGTLGRYRLSGAPARRCGGGFPLGTPAVNVPGCFLVGSPFFLSEGRGAFGETTRAALTAGLLGGFTTLSPYGVQTFALLREGAPGRAALYVVASNLHGLPAVWGGYALPASR